MDKLKNLFARVLKFFQGIGENIYSDDENTNIVIRKIKLIIGKILSFFKMVGLKILKSVNEAFMLDIEEGRNKRIAVLIATIVVFLFLFIEVFFINTNAVAVYVGEEYVGAVPQASSMRTFKNDIYDEINNKYGDTIEFTNDEITMDKVSVDVEDMTTYDETFNNVVKIVEDDLVFEGYSIYVDGKEEVMLKSKEEAIMVLESILSPYRTDNTVDIGFVEEVKIEPAGGDVRKYSTKEEAKEYLTYPVIKSKDYEVKEGDTLWDIAWHNEITVDEILEMNPELTEETALQIGQVIKIVLPKPFLSTYNIERITYEDVAYRDIEVIENDKEYKTYKKVLEEGSDGERTVTDKITYVNGIESYREVEEEVITVEPVTKVVEVGTLNAPPKKAIGNFINPTTGRVTDTFGTRGGAHKGLDIANSVGTPVYASDGGVVKYSGWYGGYGNLVIIDHENGFQTYYAHNSALHVSKGERVAQGQLVASMGSTGDSTGSHCHFEIRLNGIPRNPMSYLN